MLKRAVTVILALVAAAGLTAGCTRSEQGSAAPAPAPDFTLQDLSGNTVHLADMRGKVVLVEFWATWCGPCRESIPDMERLHKTYGSRGLVTLGVSVDEGGWDDVVDFTRDAGISYAVLKGDEDILVKYMVRAIPTVFVVDKSGQIAKQYMGGGYGEELERDIRSLL